MPQRVLDFAGLAHVGDHLHGGRVIVGEEQALAFIQLADDLHLLLGQREIKDVKVLLHPLLVGGFGDDHHVALQQKAQGGLRGGFVILLTDFVQDGIGEKVVASLGEGAPGLVLHAVLFHVLVRGLLLMEDVGLHLVDRRGDFGELAQVDQAVGIKIADADGAQLASTVGLFHRAVGAVIVAERLVNQQQIDVVGVQLLQRTVDGGLCHLVSGVGDPHLGGQEQLVPRHAAFLDGGAHRLLVAVGLGGIDGAVAHRDGVQHAAFTFLAADLVDAVAKFWHLDAVVECYIFHHDFILPNCNRWPPVQSAATVL